MKTLYLDCGMGAAGDMLTAALLELVPDRDSFIKELNAVGIPGAVISAEKAVKCGIQGTHVSVMINGAEESEESLLQSDGHHSHDNHHAHDDHHSHEDHHSHDDHHHSSLSEITEIIQELHIPKRIKSDVKSVYSIIADAESCVHGVPVTDIHFHEVGTMDALADITAVCMLIGRIAPDEIVVSPVHVGSGSVRCAHGILPVPAPATAHILKDIPVYGGEIKGELCTPTGAALLKYFGKKYGDMPVMRISATGYGMGKKDFERANCVRAFLGETEDPGDTVVELICNIDDMTPEAVGFAEETLLAAGALDVFTLPAQMKKSRPGFLLSVLCRPDDRETMIGLVFRHTSTIGIREHISRRYTLSRHVETVNSPYGEIRKKISAGYGALREKYEYDDLARIARENNISLSEVIKSITE